MTKRSLSAKIALSVAPLALFAAACGSDDASSSASDLTFDMSAVDDSGVSGSAELSQDGEAVTGTIELTGFEPNTSHAMHLHGEAEADYDCDNRTTNHLITFPDLVADDDGSVTADIDIEATEGFVKSGTYVMVHQLPDGEVIEADMDMDDEMAAAEDAEDAEMDMEPEAMTEDADMDMDMDMDMEDDGHSHTHGDNPAVSCGNAA